MKYTVSEDQVKMLLNSLFSDLKIESYGFGVNSLILSNEEEVMSYENGSLIINDDFFEKVKGFIPLKKNKTFAIMITEWVKEKLKINPKVVWIGRNYYRLK